MLVVNMLMLGKIGNCAIAKLKSFVVFISQGANQLHRDQSVIMTLKDMLGW